MTPAEHYREAERLLSLASTFTHDPEADGWASRKAEPLNPPLQAHLVALANGHAKLAEVGAILVAGSSHSPARAALVNAVLGTERHVDMGPD